MADSRFFSTTKKGEIHELKEELRALDRVKRKAAVKKVIAAMTVGKDVSMLFPDVVNCMQTDDLELKKLVYLYLINYAKTQPDLAIMGVNTFVKDTQDPNPLIRSLAVRTMGCIRVDKITEYLCDPLQRCLKDDDPYVRKTAAICVAKLFDINAELVHDRGFLDALLDLLGDSNPMVVANALASLSEIREMSTQEVVQFTPQLLFKLLRALNECTEWGQVFILDALSSYRTENSKDAEAIIERVTPRLQHANSAVVLSAVKVIFQQLASSGQATPDKALLRKITPSLVTLLAAEPEIQFVALRNINIIVEKYPGMLSHEVKVFFCKYNDPSYVKMEKLEIMIKLASAANIDQVLMEFKEYASEVDVDFVRKAVRAIGRCAVTLETAAEQCINVLVELIKARVSYVVQESVVVIKDIFRRYPNKYEGIISLLCEALDALDEPEAKASMVWIIGEYAERIDNADELLEQFLDNFPEETNLVQLQLVSAAVKLFLKKPTGKPQAMIQLVLTYATQATDNPDLRDRAYIYWRLLSTDPEAARSMVLAEKPIIADTSSSLEPELLEVLFSNLSMLASVYHKPAETFASHVRPAVMQVDQVETPAAVSSEPSATDTEEEVQQDGQQQTPAPVSMMDDLLDLGHDDEPEPDQLAGSNSAQEGLKLDLAGRAGADDRINRKVLLTSEAGNGLVLSGSWSRGPAYTLHAENHTSSALTEFMIQFNKNAFGLVPQQQIVPFAPIEAGATGTATVQLATSMTLFSPDAEPCLLQVAIKTAQQEAMYFEDSVPLHALLSASRQIAPSEFDAVWHSLTGCESIYQPAGSLPLDKLEAVLRADESYNVLPSNEGSMLRFSASADVAPERIMLLGTVACAAAVHISVRTSRPEFAAIFMDEVEQLCRLANGV